MRTFVVAFAICFSFLLVNMSQAQGTPTFIVIKGAGSFAFSPDGKKIVTDGNTVRIWDADTGKELHNLGNYGGTLWRVRFLPDGERIMTAGGGRNNRAVVRIWDVESGRELRKLEGHTGGVNSAIFSPDGKKIVTASSDKTARIWDTESGRELRRLKGKR